MYIVIVRPMQGRRPERVWAFKPRREEKGIPPIIDPVLQRGLKLKREEHNRNAEIEIQDMDRNTLLLIESKGRIWRIDENTGEKRRIWNAA